MDKIDVDIHLVGSAGIRAIVTVTIDDCFVIKGLKIIRTKRGLRLQSRGEKCPEWLVRPVREAYREEVRLKRDAARRADGASS